MECYGRVVWLRHKGNGIFISAVNKGNYSGSFDFFIIITTFYSKEIVLNEHYQIFEKQSGKLVPFSQFYTSRQKATIPNRPVSTRKLSCWSVTIVRFNLNFHHTKFRFRALFSGFVRVISRKHFTPIIFTTWKFFFTFTSWDHNDNVLDKNVLLSNTSIFF